MYLMVSHIPVYVDGSRYYTDINWQRDLVLARDWLARPFGGLKLLAPSLPVAAVEPDVMQLSPIGHDDEIQIIPSFDSRCGNREFWLQQRRRWLDDVQRALRQTTVIHTSACNAYRPLAFLAHKAGVKSDVATILVGPDRDPYVTEPANIKGRLYCMIFEQFMRYAVCDADLVLLKEGLVHDRYARYGRNVRAFCHTMYAQQDVLNDIRLEKRLETLGRERPLKVVYAGRFIPLKGLHHSIATIAAARHRGVNVEFHLFGSGPEEDSLRRLVIDLGVEDLVHFHGFVEYDGRFIARLADYDLLLYMPTEEDTPRMVFDAMAAGLPVVGSRIPFLEHRVKNDRMGILVDIGDDMAAADCLRQLHEEPEQLKILSRAALAAGRRHSSEEWYRRRAEWTQEAVERHELNRGMP